MKKNRITQINFPKPDYGNLTQPKEKIVLTWLISWVTSTIKTGDIEYGMLLPLKSQLAIYLGVSTGTVQNAIREAEDMGYFESKQSVGTLIKNPLSDEKTFEKMISKKDAALEAIKKYIIENKIKPGAALPDVNDFSLILSTHTNTVRLALMTLEREGVIERFSVKGNKISRILKKKIDFNTYDTTPVHAVENVNLIKKTADKMKNYIAANFNAGDKILPNEAFAKMFHVSIRTVNEAAGILKEQKIILSRRGRYGTIYLNDPQKIQKQKEREEKSLFMSGTQGAALQKTYLYSWETTLEALKKYIIQNHESGDKIPSMKKLADILNVSTNTIKRAVSILCEEGYLIAQRGKYGGVFILEMPQKDPEAFRWLALNPDVIKVKKSEK